MRTCSLATSIRTIRSTHAQGLLVVLQRDAVIDDVASFDDGFDVIPDLRRID